MKKITTIICTVLLTLPTQIFASPVTIEQLQEQIKVLQAQIAQMTGELSATKKDVAIIKEELRITKTLKIGMTDEEVNKLQEFLSTMPDVYPEGMITGYFGSLTEKAVKKWQGENGLESVGIVGPKTRAKLGELSGKIPFPNSSMEGLRATTTPRGLENREENRPTTTPSGTIPAIPAIPANRDNGTTTPATPAVPATPEYKDITPPVISNVRFEDTTASSTKVLWNTDEESTGSATITSISKTVTALLSSVSQSVFLDGLSPRTTYSVLIAAKDASGNESSITAEVTTLHTTCYPLGCPINGHQAFPRIFGQNVVYATNPGTNWGLSYINLSTKERREIVSSNTGIIPWQGEYDVSDTKIVYRRSTGVYGADIYLYDIPTETSKKISSNGFSPYISGNYVVWYSINNGNTVVLYDIAQDTAKEITIPGIFGIPSGFARPAVYNNTVVYEADPSGDLYLYDIPSGTSRKIAVGNAPQIFGDYVVWTVGLSQSGANPIVLYQISTQTQKEIGRGDAVQIYGDVVVYRNSSDQQVHAYSISSGQTASDFGTGGTFSGPDVHGNILVWADNRNSSSNPSAYTDIYFGTLPSSF